ncbi:MAG: hypothetical protein N2202_01125 [Proteobacteria bacterium]|nr:hypothetical protein [Pseudomonadota bacterium]
MLSKFGEKRTLNIFYLSFSVLTFELLLTRIFSVLMWYHFASLAIGIAMLGLGLGAVTAFLFKNRYDKFFEIAFLMYIFYFLILHLLFFLLHQNTEVILPYLSFFHQPYFQPFQRGVFYSFNYSLLIGIVIFYIIILVPFVVAGYLISCIFRMYSLDSQRLYYSDMFGAGLASVFLAISLYLINPMSVFSLLSLIGIFIYYLNVKRKILFLPVMLISLSLLYASIVFKKDEIMIARGKLQKNIIWSKWNPFSRVIVYPLKDEEKVNPFGQSPLYRGYIPDQWGVLVDDTGYTVASEFPDKAEKKEFFRWNIVSLPYTIRTGSTLIIGPGGGKDINCAISMGVGGNSIKAVELNPQVVEAVNEVLGEKTGKLYSQVKTYIKEGRSFLERDKEKYDVIQATSVYGRIPPASGIFTFAEDNLYTLEAFITYLNRLKEGGVLVLSRFIYEKTIPKMVLLSIEALRQIGYEKPNLSIFLARERGLATLLVKKGFFTPNEVETLKNFCKTRDFEILYEPFDRYENFYGELITGSSSYSLILPTDDRPFYYYNLSKKDFMKSIIFGNDSFEERGVNILRIFTFLSLVFSFIIFILPFFIKSTVKVEGKMKLISGALFALLGFGYILIEIVMIKNFTLFLETPVYSMIFVVGSMLISSSIGSLCSRNYINSYSDLKKFFLVLILLIIILSFILKQINHWIYLPFLTKIVIAVAIVGVLGFFMGIPFPVTLKVFGTLEERLVAWGLSINSVFSVIGSFVTLMFVVNFGYHMTFLIGFIVYLLAFITFLILNKSYVQK